MRADKKKRFDRFVHEIGVVIEDETAIGNVEFEGYQWAYLPQAQWCSLLEVSGPTLRELAKHPPIVATKTVDSNGIPAVLYRLGDAPHGSFRHTANKMAIVFRKKLGISRIASEHWACLLGLAELWPQGLQVDIFRTVIAHWDVFMGGVGGYETEEDCELYAGRFYKYPLIPLIRKYPHIGVEMHIFELQGKKQKVPPSLVAACQILAP